MIFAFVLLSTVVSAAGSLLLLADLFGFFGDHDVPTPGSLLLVSVLIGHAATGVLCLGALS